MTKHTLSVEPRQTLGRKVKLLRKSGIVPANIYGKSVTSISIQLGVKDLKKVQKEAGESSLLYLNVAGEKDERPVLIREVLVHPVTSEILHVSFNQVSLKEKVSASVPLVIEGEAPADRDKLGILVKQLDEVEIEALPTNIPEGLKVDISTLTEVGMAIYVKDLSVDSSKISIVTDPETVIVKIEPLAAEEVAEAPAAPTEGEAPAAESAEAPAAAPATEEKAAE